MSDPRLVIWDVDGTLVDSRAAITDAMRGAFASEALPYPGDAAVIGRVGLSIDTLVAELLPEAPERCPALVRAYLDRFRASRESLGSLATAPFFPGVRPALERIRGLPGMTMGIATGKSRRGLTALIAAHGLDGWFASLHCADDHPGKPDPSMLQAVLSDTGVPADRAVMVGDTHFDMDMGRAAGVATLGVGWGFQPPERLRADRIVTQPDDLAAAVLELTGEMA